MAKTNPEPRCPPGEKEFVSGYPTIICDVLPRNKFLCCNCHNVLRKAQQTMCGHRYCSLCLSWIVRKKERPICPKCQEEEADPASLTDDCLLTRDRTFIDSAINKEISELRAHCVTAGCHWSGTLKDYDDHENLCEYAQIPCHTGCGCMVVRRQLADHLEHECANNRTFCSKCSQRISNNVFPKHNCEKALVENLADKKTEHQGKGKGHTAGGSSKKEACPFYNFGCTFRGSKEKIKEHERTSASQHLALIFPLILQFKRGDSLVSDSLSNSTGCPSAKSFASLQSWENGHRDGVVGIDYGQETARPNVECNLPGHTQRLLGLESRVQVFENIITVLNRELDNCHARLAAVQEQSLAEQNKLKNMEQQVVSLQRALSVKEMAFSQLSTHMHNLEQTTYDGIFLWKISNLMLKCQDAISGRTVGLYSPAFYSAKYGYKVCLRIYLNGDGAGKGTHVSLFFVIMKGEYDTLLPWPFKHKVTFMLLDQSNREHILDAFRPDMESASFQRPVTDMNIASGCPLFCPLSKLQLPKNPYIREDAMFIKCIIETSS
ncbi:TNF receptor-associated factor 1 [Pelodytes ibericus]